MRSTHPHILMLVVPLWFSASCAAPTNVPPERAGPVGVEECGRDDVTLARCVGEGGAGATVCLRAPEGEDATLKVSWSTRAGGDASTRSWSGDALEQVRWSRDAGRAHVNSTIGWTHEGRTLLLTLHTRLATETSPARHAGALRSGAPEPTTVRCARLAPHDPLPLQTTPATRLSWAPGW